MADNKVIYALHGPDGAYRYIGMTRVGAKKRLQGHLYSSRSTVSRVTDRPVPRWIRKIGPNNVSMVTLFSFPDETPLEVVYAKEIECIEQYRKTSRLLNLSAGGEGPPTNLSTGSRAKLATNKGKKFTQTHKDRISAQLKGRTRSEEHSRNISRAKTGTTHSEASNKQRSETLKGREGRKRPQSEIDALTEHNRGRKNTEEQSKRWAEAQLKVSGKNQCTRFHKNKSIYRFECKWCNSTLHVADWSNITHLF